MTLEEIQILVNPQLEAVEKMIHSTLQEVENTEAKKWMGYFCNKTGHRLRPMLTVIAYKCFKQPSTLEEERELIKLATVLELLHTASLIHDDVIDLEEDRRGQVALQNLVGNKNAILVGNIFYLKAFEIASTLPNLSYFREMLQTSMAMCFGEVTQGMRIHSGMAHSREEYLEVVQNKTGKLISACLFLGSKLAQVQDEVCETLKKIGLILGTLYQMRDDIKDGDANISAELDLVEVYHTIVSEYHVLLSTLDRENRFVKMLEAFFTIITKNIK